MNSFLVYGKLLRITYFNPHDESSIAHHDTAALLPLLSFPSRLDFMSVGDRGPLPLSLFLPISPSPCTGGKILAYFVEARLSHGRKNVFIPPA